jgi:hypothetical protein
MFPIVRRSPAVTADAVATGIDRIGCHRCEFFIPIDSHQFSPAEPPLILFYRSSTMSGSQRFLLEDSSSSNDSDIDKMILDNDIEQAMVIVAVENHQDRMAMKRRRGSVPGRITIPRNRATVHEALMQDYFVEVPTYPPSLFHRRYRMRR